MQALVLQAPSVKAKEEVVPQALAIKYEVEKEVPPALTKRQKKRKCQNHAQYQKARMLLNRIMRVTGR